MGYAYLGAIDTHRYGVEYGERTMDYQYFHIHTKNKAYTTQTNIPMMLRGVNDINLWTSLAEGTVGNKEFFNLVGDAICWEIAKKMNNHP